MLYPGGVAERGFSRLWSLGLRRVRQRCRQRQPLASGQVVAADLALGPSATLLRAGETLRLVVAGRWLWPRNPLTGQFPAAYAKSPRGRCTLHWGPDRPARLLLPFIP